MKQSINILISGGGTGGHIYPAIAIANELKARYPKATFLFIGAKDRMEMEKVPKEGYEIKGLWISGIQRKLSFKNILFPFKFIFSLLKAGRIIRKFKPNVVIGTGGYASGPLLFIASLLGKPTLIQEQNSYPGVTNKLLATKAQKICVAYENLESFFPKDKIVVTGNPVRQDLLDLNAKQQEAQSSFALDPSKKTLLVLGGSLGARRINQMVEEHLPFFKKNNIQLVWQCGKLYFDDYKSYNDIIDVQVLSFIKRMDLAYAAADIIISRAGASSVSELCIVGKPVVFIPSPNVAEDHQTKNALAVSSHNAALLIPEKDLNQEFEAHFSNLLSNKELQQQLSTNIKKLAKPSATDEIVIEIEKLINA